MIDGRGLTGGDVVADAGAYRYDVRTGPGDSRTRGLTMDPDADARITIDSGAGSTVLRGS